MAPDLAEKVAKGEMPDDWYRVANTEDELVEIIKGNLEGCVIFADLPSHTFRFATTIGGWKRSGGGKKVFMTGDYGDGEDGKPNPDYLEKRYADVREGVHDFKIGGRPILEVVKGKRFAIDTAPGCVIED